MTIGARDANHAGFKRLAKAVQDAALKFREFVKEQHAQMRQADLARTDLEPAADQRSHRGRMVRGAERADLADPAVDQRSRH